MDNLKQAVTKSAVDDSGKFPKVKIAYLERVGNAVVVENYGMHASAPQNSACLLITIGEDEANRFVIPLSNLKRSKGLKEGEAEFGNMVVGSLVYFDEKGNIIVTCKKDLEANVDGDVRVTAENGEVTIKSPLITLDGDVVITKSVDIKDEDLTGSFLRGILQNLIAIQGIGIIQSGTTVLATHVHTGVQTGPSLTGPPA